MNSSPPTVLMERDGAVLTIRLNRPEALNALNAATYAGLGVALIEAASRSVRAVVLTGSGRAFCPGQDLNDAAGDDPAADLRLVDGTVRALRALQKPTIAAINGAVAGGGLAYALACDIRIAASSARFAPAFMDLGLVPDLGTSWLLARAMGAERAFHWLYSGRKVSALEAQAMGLVHEVVEPAALMDRATVQARALAERATLAFGLTKGLLNAATNATFETQLELEAQAQAQAGASDDYREALAAFRERRPPRFVGH